MPIFPQLNRSDRCGMWLNGGSGFWQQSALWRCTMDLPLMFSCLATRWQERYLVNIQCAFKTVFNKSAVTFMPFSMLSYAKAYYNDSEQELSVWQNKLYVQTSNKVLPQHPGKWLYIKKASFLLLKGLAVELAKILSY